MEFLVPTLEVRMECYEGPLAVLINLIKKNRVSIWDIPLAMITERFLQYVELVREMHLKIAEDFIEIASLLIYIKSKMLLPRDPSENDEDPRDELIERIIEYEKVKNMADAIDSLPILNRDTFTREKKSIQGKEDYDLLTLCNIFFDLIRNRQERYIVVRELKPTLEEKLNMLKDILDSKGVFEWGVEEQMEHSEKVVTILGMLELTKINLATLYQRRPFSRIIMKRKNGGI
ncbi:MAG TPA: segregation/condensation protein A [Syntrophorhabdaceae bacterium]|nr:segregation/condensation protein A [Syntrophorhabdaceae bacterium]HOL05449.1 segregation/condensation protein A [Syntrophorhabdaceae bacterium]HON85091.1 segregation/condensation protein A [Syntrophorhabdaceae bacterium]HOT42575.1 segregation/condensation protein A [Syntrophorhabdaceae bacterium]HPC66751.1 segregation/condensation protein A [Syntrophorhabdaceae bacterium]